MNPADKYPKPPYRRQSQPWPDLYDYAQIKAATVNYVKSLAKQLAPKGIRVARPGLDAAAGQRRRHPGQAGNVRRLDPLGRAGQNWARSIFSSPPITPASPPAKSMARRAAAAAIGDRRRSTLSKSESVTLAAIEEGVPAPVEARQIVSDFHGMARAGAEGQLPAWIDHAAISLVGSFANGIRRDIAAVSSPRSNGKTEGQVASLHLVK